MVTAMLMVYLNLSKSASLPLGLLGRLDQRVNPLHGPCVNLGNYHPTEKNPLRLPKTYFA